MSELFRRLAHCESKDVFWRPTGESSGGPGVQPAAAYLPGKAAFNEPFFVLAILST